MTTDLYAVQIAQFTSGDVSGILLTEDGNELYTHISSSLGWLWADLTTNFGRTDELEARFGDYRIIEVSLQTPMPPKIADYFKPPPPASASKPTHPTERDTP